MTPPADTEALGVGPRVHGAHRHHEAQAVADDGGERGALVLLDETPVADVLEPSVGDVGGDLLHGVEAEVAAVGEDRGQQRADLAGVDLLLARLLEVDAEPEVVLDLDEQVGQPDGAAAGVQPAVQLGEALRLRRVGLLGRVRRPASSSPGRTGPRAAAPPARWTAVGPATRRRRRRDRAAPRQPFADGRCRTRPDAGTHRCAADARRPSAAGGRRRGSSRRRPRAAGPRISGSPRRSPGAPVGGTCRAHARRRPGTRSPTDCGGPVAGRSRVGRPRGRWHRGSGRYPGSVGRPARSSTVPESISSSCCGRCLRGLGICDTGADGRRPAEACKRERPSLLQKRAATETGAQAPFTASPASTPRRGRAWPRPLSHRTCRLSYSACRRPAR